MNHGEYSLVQHLEYIIRIHESRKNISFVQEGISFFQSTTLVEYLLELRIITVTHQRQTKERMIMNFIFLHNVKCRFERNVQLSEIGKIKNI